MEKCMLIFCVLAVVGMMCKLSEGSCFFRRDCNYQGVMVPPSETYLSMSDCVKCSCSRFGTKMQCCSIGIKQSRPAPKGCKIVNDSRNQCVEMLVKETNENELCDDESGFVGR